MSRKKSTKKSKAVADQKTATEAVETATEGLGNFLSNVSKQIETKEVQTSRDSRNKHPYRIKEGTKVSTVAVKSRRRYVAEMLHEGKHTKAEINQSLIAAFDIADKPNNLKAISGTMYDLQQHGKCNFKTDSETGVISCLSTNCKYRPAE